MNSNRNDEFVVFGEAEVTSQTERAVKLKLSDGGEMWFPKSVIKLTGSVLEVAMWFCEKNDLEPPDGSINVESDGGLGLEDDQDIPF